MTSPRFINIDVVQKFCNAHNVCGLAETEARAVAGMANGKYGLKN